MQIVCAIAESQRHQIPLNILFLYVLKCTCMLLNERNLIYFHFIFSELLAVHVTGAKGCGSDSLDRKAGLHA